jgi:hypothetical protein
MMSFGLSYPKDGEVPPGIGSGSLTELHSQLERYLDAVLDLAEQLPPVAGRTRPISA